MPRVLAWCRTLCADLRTGEYFSCQAFFSKNEHAKAQLPEFSPWRFDDCASAGVTNKIEYAFSFQYGRGNRNRAFINGSHPASILQSWCFNISERLPHPTMEQAWVTLDRRSNWRFNETIEAFRYGGHKDSSARECQRDWPRLA